MSGFLTLTDGILSPSEIAISSPLLCFLCRAGAGPAREPRGARRAAVDVGPSADAPCRCASSRGDASGRGRSAPTPAHAVAPHDSMRPRAWDGSKASAIPGAAPAGPSRRTHDASPGPPPRPESHGPPGAARDAPDPCGPPRPVARPRRRVRRRRASRAGLLRSRGGIRRIRRRAPAVDRPGRDRESAHGRGRQLRGGSTQPAAAGRPDRDAAAGHARRRRHPLRLGDGVVVVDGHEPRLAADGTRPGRARRRALDGDGAARRGRDPRGEPLRRGLRDGRVQREPDGRPRVRVRPRLRPLRHARAGGRRRAPDRGALLDTRVPAGRTREVLARRARRVEALLPVREPRRSASPLCPPIGRRLPPEGHATAPDRPRAGRLDAADASVSVAAHAGGAGGAGGALSRRGRARRRQARRARAAARSRRLGATDAGRHGGPRRAARRGAAARPSLRSEQPGPPGAAGRVGAGRDRGRRRDPGGGLARGRHDPLSRRPRGRLRRGAPPATRTARERRRRSSRSSATRRRTSRRPPWSTRAPSTATPSGRSPTAPSTRVIPAASCPT